MGYVKQVIVGFQPSWKMLYFDAHYAKDNWTKFNPERPVSCKRIEVIRIDQVGHTHESEKKKVGPPSRKEYCKL